MDVSLGNIPSISGFECFVLLYAYVRAYVPPSCNKLNLITRKMEFPCQASCLFPFSIAFVSLSHSTATTAFLEKHRNSQAPCKMTSFTVVTFHGITDPKYSRSRWVPALHFAE